MKNKFFKTVVFFSIMSIIFVGGNVFAATCAYPLPVWGTWPYQSMSNVTLFCGTSSDILTTRYNNAGSNLGRMIYATGSMVEGMIGTPTTNSTVYSFTGYPIRTHFVWQCADSDGSNPILCNGSSVTSACGSSSGGSFNSTPSTNLCTYGTASSVSYTIGMRIQKESGYADYSYVYYWKCTNSGNTGDETYCFARANQAPTVNAGIDKTVNEGQQVALSDANASDYHNDTLSYSWSCTGGSLSSSTILNPTFTAPSVSTNTNYTCTLTVNDGNGKTASDSVMITVTNIPVNGSCGTANGHGYYSTSSINTSALRCASGTFTSFTDAGSSWTWACAGIDGGTIASCSAFKVSCGTYHNTVRRDQPSTNLCTYGSSTTLSPSGNIWYYYCTNNPGVNAACYVYKTSCGSSNGGSFSSPPSTNLCTYGTASSVTTGETTYTWTCTGNDSLAVSCSATKIIPINGVCGSSNGGSFSIAPTTNLCSAGTASSVTTNPTTFTWTCSGTGGGTTASCSANITPTNGSCGTANGHGYTSTSEIDTSTERCATGTFTSFTDNGSSWSWGCTGLNGGTTASCGANKVASGISHNTTLKDQPSTNLCLYGTSTTVNLINNIWYWTCTNNPGVDAAGYTYKTTCGTANGQYLSSAPSTNLCVYGTASSVSGSGPWTWTCTGNDSLAVSCSANIISSGCGTANGHGYTSTSEIDTSEERCSTGIFGGSFIDNGSFWNWSCSGSSSWSSKTTMSSVRSDADVVAVNGKIYAIGGNNGSSYVSSVEEYDPTTDTWTTRASMPTLRQGYAKAVVIDNKVYVLGGTDGASGIKNNEMYDPTTNTWTTKASMPIHVPENQITSVNGKIYIIDLYGTVRPSYEYDPATNTWTAKAYIPNQRTDDGAIITVVNNKIYVIGGSLSGTSLTATDEYDPSTNTWTTKASMNYARTDAVFAVINNKIYAMGGKNSLGTELNCNEEYDPSTNTWTTKASVPYIAYSGSQPAGTVTVNNKIYRMGGNTGYTTAMMYEYDPTTNTWTAKSNMPNDKSRFGLVVVDGKIYTIGGYAYRSTYPYYFYLNVNEVYDLSFPCSANKVASGTSHNATLKDQPSTNLCTYGTPTTLNLTNNIWYWSCTNNPGVDAISYAYKTSCGSSNGGVFSSAPTTNLCLYGTASSVSGSGPWTWTCTGNDSLAVSCSASSNYSEFVCGGDFTDSRDGQIYSTVQINDQCWMKENLNYTSVDSLCYDNNSANCDSYGRLYDGDVAKTVCPSGWHLPTKTEQDALITFTDSWSNVGQLMAAPPVWDGEDTYGFNILPSGIFKDGNFEPGNLITYPITCFWINNDEGWFYHDWIIFGTGSITQHLSNTKANSAYSVRCIKDSSTIINGSCGSSNGQIYSSVPSSLCNAGTPSGVTTNTTSYTWTCTGSGGGTNASCLADRISFKNPLDLDINNTDESCFYCDYYYDNSGVLKKGSLNTSTGRAQPTLGFVVNNTKYINYKIKVGNAETTSWLPINNQSIEYTGLMVGEGVTTDSAPSNYTLLISYGNGSVGKTYNWYVNLEKQGGGETGWISAGTFNTPKKPYPIVKIATASTNVYLNTNVQYCTTTNTLNRSTDTSACFDICWKGTGDVASLISSDWKCSICYDSSGDRTLCSTSNSQFSWSLPLTVGSYQSQTGVSSPNPIFKYTSSIGILKPGLAITGSECAAEGDTGTKVPLPIWRESN